MMEEIHGPRVPVKLWARAAEVDAEALAQLEQIAALPWVVHHVAAMPDVHYGRGSTVGSVVAMDGAVAPAAVGVDIGCGVAAVSTNQLAARLPDDLAPVRAALEGAIPVGRHLYPKPVFGAASEALAGAVRALMGGFSTLAPGVQRIGGRAARQLGTLGGGNHFIELCLDKEQRIWLLLHAGSRQIGKELAELHIGRARHLAHNQELPDPDLAVFLAGTAEMDAYRRDLYWAQEYARLNRLLLLERCLSVLAGFWPSLSVEQAVHCHHNYVAEEVHFGDRLFVTRKGAIRAGRGEMGIIPGSMGARSYIVRGLGNPQSFESAAHGAGRRLPRGRARERYSVEDLIAQTAGIECRKDAGLLDELPGAYKDIETVMSSQRDLVEITAELKQVLCIKG